MVFKAEVGSLSRSVALIQGVWVHPELRGRGLAAPAMAAVVRSIQHDLRRTPSLYVNQYNHAALRTYSRIGFTQIGTVRFRAVLNPRLRPGNARSCVTFRSERPRYAEEPAATPNSVSRGPSRRRTP